MLLIIALLSLCVSGSVNGAHVNDLTDEVAERYFGEHFVVLKTGNVDLYWLYAESLLIENPEISGVEDSLMALETTVEALWSDKYDRMSWVRNPQTQIIDPINNLCKAEQDFTLLSCLGKPARPEDGKFLLEKFQLFRKYYILSEVTSYLCCADSEQPVLKKGRKFFASEAAFMDFCQHYTASKLTECPRSEQYSRTPKAFQWQEKENLINATYAWYTHFAQSQAVKVLGYRSSDAAVKEYERMAALAQGRLLIHMPYMDQEATYLRCDQSRNLGWFRTTSFDCFASSFKEAQSLTEGLALSSHVFPSEQAFLKRLIAEMKDQMKGADSNLREMLKIMICFSASMSDILSPKMLLTESFDALIQHFHEQGISCAEADLHKVLCGHVDKDVRDAECKRWRTQYVITGVKNIFTGKVMKPLKDSMGLLEQEFGLTNEVSAWDIVHILEGVQAAAGKDLLASCAAIQMSLNPHDLGGKQRQWDLAHQWGKDFKKIKKIRYTLWPIKQPFIDWNETEEVLIVCLPQRAKMAPLIKEMQGLESPIMLERSHHRIVDILCRKRLLTYYLS